MAGALTFLIIGCLLQGVQCGQWRVNMLQTIEVLRGSCVTIPCYFDIESTYNNYLDQTCKAMWRKKSNDEDVFDSKTRKNGELMGVLTDRDCTTTLNNMISDDTYYFRLECNDPLKYGFKNNVINIVTKADPPSPTLTPSTLEVEEGTSVSLTCSAPAPCLSHPPTLTWSPRLGDSQETLQENQDKTKVQTSVLTFTASHLHHGRKISCTAVHRKQDGSPDASVTTSLTADVSYSPKDTTVSISPSGPVPENRNVTLTCSSTANPAVRNYTWYRADRDQETLIGTGHILNIEASKVSSPFFCKAENDLGVGRSNDTQIDVQFPPQILASSHCNKTESQVTCSCETVGNPSPTLHWYLDGRPVNQSGEFLISSESLNDTGLRSFITVNQLKERSLPTLLCHSFNSLGSARQQFCVNTPETQSSAENQGQVTLVVFITTTITLLVLVCVLLFRTLKTHRDSKSQLTGETSPAATSQHLIREENEVPNEREEDIYVNTDGLRQADSAHPGTISEQNGTNLPSAGPENVQGESQSSEKNGEGSDVVYANVSWKKKSKKNKVEDSVDMNPSGSSYLEEEKYMAEGMCKNFVSNAMVMGNLYDEAEPRNEEKEVECEYAQVKFKKKSTRHK